MSKKIRTKFQITIQLTKPLIYMINEMAQTSDTKKQVLIERLLWKGINAEMSEIEREANTQKKKGGKTG